jgi:hypothetical protein
MAGQLYVAIVIARMVGVQVTQQIDAQALNVIQKEEIKQENKDS